MSGHVVLLNGVPRAGKSSIAAYIQQTFDGPWVNLGVDVFMRFAPRRYWPGIGLRPGGERPDLEDFIVRANRARFASVAAHARCGINVVCDEVLHDGYSRPLGLLREYAASLEGLRVVFVGVRCRDEEVIRRRAATGRDPVPETIIRRFEQAIHSVGTYDLEVDTAELSPQQCAAVIERTIKGSLDRSALFTSLEARS